MEGKTMLKSRHNQVDYTVGQNAFVCEDAFISSWSFFSQFHNLNLKQILHK